MNAAVAAKRGHAAAEELVDPEPMEAAGQSVATLKVEEAEEPQELPLVRSMQLSKRS